MTAISSSSITVQDSRTSSSSTYVISSATTVTDDGADSTVSAIQTGDTVMISTGSSDSKTAKTIMLNPTMGGPQSDGSSSTKTN